MTGQGSPAEEPEQPRKARRVGAKKADGERTCPMCGNMLRPRQKVCSDACRALAYRERKKKRKKKKQATT